ncbi:hypothetical protein D3C78_1743030 [compost metagenome]
MQRRQHLHVATQDAIGEGAYLDLAIAALLHFLGEQLHADGRWRALGAGGGELDHTRIVIGGHAQAAGEQKGGDDGELLHGVCLLLL